MATAAELIPLRFLLPGETAQVSQLCGSLEHRRHLQELGLREGALIQMLQRGNPCIVELGNARLCFRETEGCQVLVERVAIA